VSAVCGAGLDRRARTREIIVKVLPRPISSAKQLLTYTKRDPENLARGLMKKSQYKY